METLINILSGLTAIDERTVNKINELSGRAEQYVLSSQVYSKDEIDKKLQDKEEEIQNISEEVDNVNIRLDDNVNLLSTTISNLSSETSEISSFLFQQIISSNNDISIISSSLNNTISSIQYLSGQISGNTQNIEILSVKTQELSGKVQAIASAEFISSYLQLKDNVLMLKNPREVSGIISAAGFQIHKSNRNLVLTSSSISLTTPIHDTTIIDKDISLFNLNIGDNNIINGYAASAIGSNNYISGSFSITIGQSLKSTAKRQLIIGQYNQPNNTFAFSIGNGIEQTKRSNAFSVDISGNGMFQGYVDATGFKLNGHGINTAYGLPQLNKDAKIPSSLISWEGVPIDFKSSDYLPVSGGTMSGRLVALKGITLSGSHGITNDLSDSNISIMSFADFDHTMSLKQNLFNITVGIRNQNIGKFNLDFGYNNSVSGNYNEVFGYVSPISGNYNKITGQHNQISGVYSSIYGLSSSINGLMNNSVGIQNFIVKSNYSTIFGYSNSINVSSTSSACNYIYGRNNKIYGTTSQPVSLNFIVGNNNITNGANNTIIGGWNNIQGKDSFNIGYNLKNNGNIYHLQGRWNQEITSQKKYIEVIGCGTDENHRKNAYIIDAYGNATYNNDLTIKQNMVVSGTTYFKGGINSPNFLNWQGPQGGSHVGQVLVRTATGFSSASVSGGASYIQVTTSSDDWISSNVAPIAIRTNSPSLNIYPIEAGFTKMTTDGKFLISIRPYLMYQEKTAIERPTKSKPWRIYLASSSSGISPGQNTVYYQTCISDTTDLNYNLGDIQVLTVKHNTNLIASNIPIGSAMIVKCILQYSFQVKYNDSVLINLPGNYFLTFINITGNPELMGDIVESHVIDY